MANARPVTQSVYHPDPQSTLYLRLEFPAGALASLDGVELTAGDSVRITATPLAGGYGVTLSPDGLTFSSANTPTLLFSYGRYGDASAASALFPDQNAYLAALEVWEETGFDRWVATPRAGGVGVDEVRAVLAVAARFRLAARIP